MGEIKRVMANFANVLKEYKLNLPQEDDFTIVKEFRSISALNAQDFAASIENDVEDNQEYQDWELEVKLWHLVELLLQYRYSSKESTIETHSYNSDLIFEEKYYQDNAKLYEIWLIITWIHANASAVDSPSLSNSKWLNTRLSNNLENFDSDAPIRLDQNIEPADAEQDSLVYKHIFELLLSGDYNEASNVCENTNNWTLKMILAGVNEYIDPTIDTQLNDIDDDTITHGIKNKALWRRTVYLLSKNEKLNKYERSIYGFLVGDLAPLENSINWDTDLLIYLNHILINQVENKLIEDGRISKDNLIVNLPNIQIDAQNSLNSIANKRKDESEHPLRVLIAAVITNNIRPIIHSSLSFIGNIMLGNEEANEILNESYSLRVITHLAIFVSIIDPNSISVQDRSKLITTYILVLRLYEQYDFIPLYVSYLPELEAREAYSLFLIDLFDSEVRTKQLELSRLYKLPLENILKRTVERVFALTEDYYKVTKSSISLKETDEVDDKLIRGVEWFIEAKMYSDAIHSIISLFRRFLLNGKTRAVQEFCSRNSIQQILKQYDIESLGSLVEQEVLPNERKELLQYELLTNALNAIDEWKSSNKSVRTISFIDTINRVSSILLEAINEFFVELSLESYEIDLVQDLRSIFVPYLIIQLHNVYLDGKSQNPQYLRNALELTNLVANESSKLYILFQNSDRLKEYLNLVAQCAALAAGEGF